MLAARSYPLPRPAGEVWCEVSLWTDLRYDAGVSNLHTTTGWPSERCDWSVFEGKCHVPRTIPPSLIYFSSKDDLMFIIDIKILI